MVLRKLGNGLLQKFSGTRQLHSQQSIVDIYGGTAYKIKEKCEGWKSYNDVIYPPTARGEPQRPGYVCHVKTSIDYSYKKMWYIACFIRGMSIDEALKQLQFISTKGAHIARETLLEAQKMAVREHNIEFKTNLWVSQSFVGKAYTYRGYTRRARGVMHVIKSTFIHYFVALEEGEPPEHYYYHKRKKSGEELYQEWLDEMRGRKILNSL